MAELRPYNPTMRDRLAQFLLGDSRASSFKGDVVEGLLGSTGLGNSKMGLADVTPAGMAFSAEDTARSLADGNYKQAALDSLGVIPWGAVSKGFSMAKNVRKSADSLASRSAFVYDTPTVEQREFAADYPNWRPENEGEKLQFDIDGKPLTTELVAGRRFVGGPDEPLSPSDVASVAKDGTGSFPQAVTSRELKGDVGRYEVTRDRRSNRVLSRDIYFLQSLPIEKAERVMAHEVGHYLDDIAGKIPVDGLNDEFRLMYNDMNNPQNHGKWFGPENNGYKGEKVKRELVAEGLRAYVTNPNYIKTVAPNVASRLREYVNTHPELSKIIQFNSLAAMGGAGALAMVGGADDANAAEMPSYGPRIDAVPGFPNQQSKTKQRIRSMITGPDGWK